MAAGREPPRLGSVLSELFERMRDKARPYEQQIQAFSDFLNAKLRPEENAPESVIEYIVSVCLYHIQRLAHRCVIDPRDIAHDVAILLFEKRARIKDVNAIKSWLWATARFRVLQYRDAGALEETSLDDGNAPEPIDPRSHFDVNEDGSGEEENGPERLAFERAISELSEPLQVVARLWYYEDLSCKEIAERLHVAPGAVRTRLCRANAQLRRRVPELLRELR